MQKKSIYRSKVSPLFVALLTLPCIGLVWDLFNIHSTTELIIRAIFTLFIALNIYLMFSIRYILTPSELVVRFLFFSRTYPLDVFTHIEFTRNPLSAPAASLNRLELYYGKGNSILISPKEKNEFLAEIKRLNPNITLPQ